MDRRITSTSSQELSPHAAAAAGMTAKRPGTNRLDREKGQPGERKKRRKLEPRNERDRAGRANESEWNKIKEEWGLFTLLCFLGLSGGLALYILDVKHMGGQRRRQSCLARKDASCMFVCTEMDGWMDVASKRDLS